jgi:hypothetical protein
MGGKWNPWYTLLIFGTDITDLRFSPASILPTDFIFDKLSKNSITLNRICQFILVRPLATFSLKAIFSVSFSSIYYSFHNSNGKPGRWKHAGDSYSCLRCPTAALTGHVPDNESSNWKQSLQYAGFSILPVDSFNLPDCEYAGRQGCFNFFALKTKSVCHSRSILVVYHG